MKKNYIMNNFDYVINLKSHYFNNYYLYVDLYVNNYYLYVDLYLNYIYLYSLQSYYSIFISEFLNSHSTIQVFLFSNSYSYSSHYFIFISIIILIFYALYLLIIFILITIFTSKLNPNSIL